MSVFAEIGTSVHMSYYILSSISANKSQTGFRRAFPRQRGPRQGSPREGRPTPVARGSVGDKDDPPTRTQWGSELTNEDVYLHDLLEQFPLDVALAEATVSAPWRPVS